MPQLIGCALSLVSATRDNSTDPNRRFREGVTLARAAGCAAVRLDGAAAGMRGRELDRSARRDIAATLRREGMAFAGIDLWIPEKHFTDGAHADRAIDALGDACGLAGELARLTESTGATVCVTLPSDLSPTAVDAIVRPAMAAGVKLADFNRRDPEFAPVIGSGFDAGGVLLSGDDPVMSVAGTIRSLADARLTDASRLGRCPVGRGGLDVPAYRAMLESLAAIHWVSVDVRLMIDPPAAAVEAVSAWRSVRR